MPDETASTLPGSGSGDKSGVSHTSNDSDTKETGIASPDLGLPESPNKPATMSYLTFVSHDYSRRKFRATFEFFYTVTILNEIVNSFLSPGRSNGNRNIPHCDGSDDYLLL
jgi:hypothetical protein